MNTESPPPVTVDSHPPVPASRPPRLVSLDQFRGYTVLGMLVVNFLGNWTGCPSLLRHHHDHCSYADTIMPQFLFAVGFALRLTLRRSDAREGSAPRWKRVLRRVSALALISIVIYSPGVAAGDWANWSERGLTVFLRPLKREWFQTLMHIAVTSLWILPVLRGSATVRAVFAAGSGLAHVVASHFGYFHWVNADPVGIDGGPLGFLTWTIPAVVGTVACDAVAGSSKPDSRRLVFLAAALMLLGWLLSCGTRLYDRRGDNPRESASNRFAASPVWPPRLPSGERGWRSLLAEPPFVPPPLASERPGNYWMMSQRSGTLSYLTFSAGASLLVFLLFWVVCDRWGGRLRLLDTLGTNALAAYIIHGAVDSAVWPFIPKDAPGWYVAAGFSVYFGLTWIALRSLEKNGVFLRV